MALKTVKNKHGNKKSQSRQIKTKFRLIFRSVVVQNNILYHKFYTTYLKMITKNDNNDNKPLIYKKNQQKMHYNILSLSRGTKQLSFDNVHFC